MATCCVVQHARSGGLSVRVDWTGMLVNMLVGADDGECGVSTIKWCGTQ